MIVDVGDLRSQPGPALRHSHVVGRVIDVRVGVDAGAWRRCQHGDLLANLSLARSAARTRETAIRVAVGASRWHLARQFAAESTMLAMAGAAVGLLFVQWCVYALTVLRPAGLPRVSEIRLGAPVLAFTFVVAVVTTVAFGTVPLDPVDTALMGVAATTRLLARLRSCSVRWRLLDQRTGTLTRMAAVDQMDFVPGLVEGFR